MPHKTLESGHHIALVLLRFLVLYTPDRWPSLPGSPGMGLTQHPPFLWVRNRDEGSACGRGCTWAPTIPAVSYLLLAEPFLSSTPHFSGSGQWTLMRALQISPHPAGQAGQAHKPLHGLLLGFYGPPLLTVFVAGCLPGSLLVSPLNM